MNTQKLDGLSIISAPTSSGMCHTLTALVNREIAHNPVSVKLIDIGQSSEHLLADSQPHKPDNTTEHHVEDHHDRLLADASHNLPRALLGDTGGIPLTIDRLKAVAAQSHPEISSWLHIQREINDIIADLERLSSGDA